MHFRIISRLGINGTIKVSGLHFITGLLWDEYVSY